MSTLRDTIIELLRTHSVKEKVGERRYVVTAEKLADNILLYVEAESAPVAEFIVTRSEDDPREVSGIFSLTKALPAGEYRLYTHPLPTNQVRAYLNEYGYDQIFNAIAKATHIEAGAIAISVKAFREAMNSSSPKSESSDHE